MKVTSKKIKEYLTLLIPAVLSLVVWLPLLFLLSGSLVGLLELGQKLGPVLLDKPGYATWSLLPQYPTLRPYVELLLDSPGFFVQFWNTIKITIPTVLGQLVIATPAAWWFARSTGKASQRLFSLYIVLMLMPFQVTIVSNYLVVDQLNLLDNLLSIILPTIFSSFPVFLMYRFFKSIPTSIIEAAEIDGANQLKVFLQIGIPIGKAGIMTALVLGFLEAWNMIEQPMVFIKNKTLWPLSLFLPEISLGNMGLALAASVVILIPPILVFFFGQEYLEQGIAHTGTKQ